jgi:hypothetical protein
MAKMVDDGFMFSGEKMIKKKVSDYEKYFEINEKGDLLVDPEITNRRSELGRKGIWQLFNFFIKGSNKDKEEFERGISPIYEKRMRFTARKDKFYKLLVERDGEFCKVCRTTEKLQVDHVLALSRGGENELSNMQILCAYHNQSKGNR